MIIKLSDRLNRIGSYPFADVDNEVAKLIQLGINPIDFGVGDPKTPTPDIVREAIKKAVDARKGSGYPSYIGTDEYRQAIAEWTKKRFGVEVDYQKEVSSTLGAKEAVFNFHEALVNPGDYVLMPNPGYPPYEKGTLFAEGRPHFVPLLKKNRFLMDLNSIPREVIRRTKILWINYPNNPTAVNATKEFFKEVVDFGQDNDVVIASDECYTEIYYEEKSRSILEFGREGIIVFQSLSKRSSMTCYRVGWVMGDENIISAFKKLKTQIDSGTPTFIQDAAIASLKDEKHVKEMRKEYRQKRDIMVDAFTEAGLEDCRPEATLYIWQRTPDRMMSVDFAKKLLQKEIAIVVTPGSWLSASSDGVNPGDNYVRFALVPSLTYTKIAAERIKSHLKV